MFHRLFSLIGASLLVAATATAEPNATPPPRALPSAQELIARYDATMGPPHFEAVVVMTAHREDGSTRSYRIRMLKAGTDRVRSWFLEPAASRGQEILRQGENLWIYMPDLKRAIRMANRDSFQGGDFNNADVLRVNYAEDYAGEVGEDPATPNAWLLTLKARTDSASYDRVKLWLDRTSNQPIKAEYYAASGKLLRTAVFSEIRDFDGVRRPARVRMNNQITLARYSELVFERFDARVTPNNGRFVLDDLGR